ncbi:MAG: type II toxin-antitoxin system RelE/ParE family toxin [Bacteroidota bacterium]
MEVRLFWTEFAKNELQQIFNYYHKKATYKIAKKLVNDIYNNSLKLKKQPEIGQIEELLKDHKQNFRYLLFKNYKIIY